MDGELLIGGGRAGQRGCGPPLGPDCGLRASKGLGSAALRPLRRTPTLLALLALLGLAACPKIPGEFHATAGDGADADIDVAAGEVGAPDIAEVADAEVADAEPLDVESDEADGPGDGLTIVPSPLVPTVVVGTSSSGGLVLRAARPTPAVVRGTSEAGGLRVEARLPTAPGNE